MDVFITGGSGFIGGALCRALRDANRSVVVLTRTTEAAGRLPRGVEFCLGDPSESGPWLAEAGQARVVINLAGASIFGRWSDSYQQAIRDSRVRTTRHLVQALADHAGQDQRLLISASAVGYYGLRGDQDLDERSAPGDDFLARVCRDWEAEAMAAESLGVRVVCTRFGMVLGAGGGALARMLPLFRKGLGGRLGHGRQWVSWIHQKDLVTAMMFLMARPRLSGPVNLTAPHPVTNRELTRELAAALGRPAWLPVPGWAMRCVLGEVATVLLGGQKVLPAKLLEAGFSFHFPTLGVALADLLGESRGHDA